MNLDGLLLEKLARWRPDGRQDLEVSAPDSGWTTTVTADAADVVGCQLWEVALRRLGNQTPSEDLATRAKGVVGRVTGLLEPLQVIEVDTPQGTSLLRSASPGRRGGALHYYEVLLHADGAANVRRYEGPHGDEPRRR